MRRHVDRAGQPAPARRGDRRGRARAAAPTPTSTVRRAGRRRGRRRPRVALGELLAEVLGQARAQRRLVAHHRARTGRRRGGPPAGCGPSGTRRPRPLPGEQLAVADQRVGQPEPEDRREVPAADVRDERAQEVDVLGAQQRRAPAARRAGTTPSRPWPARAGGRRWRRPRGRSPRRHRAGCGAGAAGHHGVALVGVVDPRPQLLPDDCCSANVRVGARRARGSARGRRPAEAEGPAGDRAAGRRRRRLRATSRAMAVSGVRWR